MLNQLIAEKRVLAKEFKQGPFLPATASEYWVNGQTTALPPAVIPELVCGYLRIEEHESRAMAIIQHDPGCTRDEWRKSYIHGLLAKGNHYATTKEPKDQRTVILRWNDGIPKCLVDVYVGTVPICYGKGCPDVFLLAPKARSSNWTGSMTGLWLPSIKSHNISVYLDYPEPVPPFEGKAIEIVQILVANCERWHPLEISNHSFEIHNLLSKVHGHIPNLKNLVIHRGPLRALPITTFESAPNLRTVKI
ncbi:hypothetical protein ARMGADRAFT_1028271 [Armillaria gallica]|uniref:Uncharacterized protein n=1 Tax=Armillaria gallica TaxID=47427 RepID=A0A2H3DLG2_ARMGA|nr:hypothetical protein ARMGADRAFT_1028271 [Armillaria gallica]